MSAWSKFRRGKDRKLDVQAFTLSLESELFQLSHDLAAGRYRHGSYERFTIQDPKLRQISKAAVRDRIVHHAVSEVLEDIFDRTFIYDSYSSRKNKGTHRAVRRLRQFAWRLSRNNTRRVWFLKCDIRKFFDSVDHVILFDLIRSKISDERFLNVVWEIVSSFACRPGRGIPLGNLTSQIFSNIYLNPLDQFVKRTLGIKAYVRYADDFVIAGCDRRRLEDLVPELTTFLAHRLGLDLHPGKIILRSWHLGIDFLGYVLFPHHTLLRTKTKRRVLKKIRTHAQAFRARDLTFESFWQALQSYLGLLEYCRWAGIKKVISKIVVDELD